MARTPNTADGPARRPCGEACAELSWTKGFEVSCWGRESHPAAAWRPLPHMCNIGAAGWWYHILFWNWIDLYIWTYLPCCRFYLRISAYCRRDYALHLQDIFWKVHVFHGSDIVRMSWFILIPCRRWLLAIHDLLKQARPDSLKGQQVAPGSECLHVMHVTLKCHGGSCLRIINLHTLTRVYHRVTWHSYGTFGY